MFQNLCISMMRYSAQALLSAVLLTSVVPGFAQGVVTNTSDSGSGSLRAVIAAANAGDMITFNIPTSDAGYNSGTGVYTITLTSGELVIGQDLTIQGPGAKVLTISGNNASRIFFINPGATGATTGPPVTSPVVNISGMTLQNGRAKGGNGAAAQVSNGWGGAGGGGAGMGGAIFVNNAQLTLNQMAFANNQAIGGNATVAGTGRTGSGGGGGAGGDGGQVAQTDGGPGGSLGGVAGQNPAGDGGGGDGSPGGSNGMNGGFGGGGGGGGLGGAFSGGAGGFGGGGGGASLTSSYSSGSGGPGGSFGGVGYHQGAGTIVNIGAGGGGAGLGGAIFVRAGSLTITSSSFMGNSATRGVSGGGRFATNGQGKAGAIFLNTGATASTDSATVFGGNSATDTACGTTDNIDVYGSVGGYVFNDVAGRLSFSNQPGLTASGAAIVPAIQIQVTDACGSPISGFPVTISLGANPGGATLGGGGPIVSDTNGLATFPGLTVSAPGQGYTLAAGGNGVTAATSNPFQVYAAPTACTAPPGNLTAWWKGDGDATDVTGTYNGAIGGNVAFTAGKAGEAFSFDGSSSPYVALPGAAFPFPNQTPFTFELWFKTSAGGVILGQQDVAAYQTPVGFNPAVFVDDYGYLEVEMFWDGLADDTIFSNNRVNDGKWHHLAITYDGSNEAYYLDTVLSYNLSLSQTGYSLLGYQYQFGTGYGNPNWDFNQTGWHTLNGLLDEPTLYSRVLTANEVFNIFAAGPYGKCNPSVSLSPASLNFSGVAVGNSATLTTVLSNPGNSPLQISTIAVDAGDTSFTLLNGASGDCTVGTPVAPNNGSCNVRVSFSPKSSGPLTGAITISDNSLNHGGTHTIPLSGTGTSTGTTTGVSVAAGATYGQALSFQATVTPAAGSTAPPGTVTFSVDGSVVGSPVGLTNGVGTLSGQMLTAGGHTVAAAYTPGNSSFAASAGSTMVTVAHASVAVALSVSSTAAAAPGTAVTLTAVLKPQYSGTPTGTVTFYDGATSLGSAPVTGGTATLAPPALPTGAHTFTASYSGDGNFLKSSSAPSAALNVPSVQLNLAPTTLAWPGTPGFLVIVKGSAGVPTGSVNIYEGATKLATAPLILDGATVGLVLPQLTPGVHSLTAVYGGDKHYVTAGSASQRVTVSPEPVTILLGCGGTTFPHGTSVTCKATVAGLVPAQGTLTWSVDGTARSSALNQLGSATIVLTSLNAGGHTVTASYAAQGNFAAAATQTATFKVSQ